MSIIEALDMIGFAGFLRDGAMLCRWDHALIDGILVRMKCCLFPVHQGNSGPERLPTLIASVSHMKRNDLPGGRIHRNPNPLFVRLLLHEAPHLVGFRLQARHSTAAGRVGSGTWRSSGHAVKHSTIKCTSQVRLTPTVRQMPRSERRSHNSCSICRRCAGAMLRPMASAVN